MAVLTYAPAVTYATKGNIGHPGPSAQITADTTTADTILEQRLAPITVSAVAITAAR